MVLRVLKVVVQSALLVQVLQWSLPVRGENFDNTQVATVDTRGTVHAVNNYDEERDLFNSPEDDGDLPITTPIPGTGPAPTYDEVMKKFGGLLKDFSGYSSGSQDHANEIKKPSLDSSSGSGSPPSPHQHHPEKTKKPVEPFSGSDREAPIPHDHQKHHETPSNSSDAGSNDLDMLLGGGSGSGSLGSGSLSFENFLKEYGDMFGSGSSAFNLFGDPSQPMNLTVEEDDIRLGEIYGSREHGDAFSDIQNIHVGQMYLNITLRGQNRVDSISIMVMTQDAVGTLVHGGDGGTEGFIEPDTGDVIQSVEVHWGEHKGKTSIFYIRITTGQGKWIETGSMTNNRATMTPPDGYQFGGFHGRADGDGVWGIGAIWIKSSASDLKVTDIMALSDQGSPDVYHYNTTIRNWVGPLDEASDNACYMKSTDASSQGLCPRGYNKDDDVCKAQCPLKYPLPCEFECIPQNADCTQEMIAKVASVVAVALNFATMGLFGEIMATYKAVNKYLLCAINVVNAVKSLMYYLRYRQTTIPKTDTEKLMDFAFKLQIVILDLPMAVCACLGVRIPNNLQFSVVILTVVSAVVMMAVMIGEALFSSPNNVLLMLREAGVMNTTKLSTSPMELEDFLNSKNGTCGYEIQTLTNRVIGTVRDIRNNTPEANPADVRLEVSKTPIFVEDIPIVTNNCMGEIWANQTSAAAFQTRNLLRKTLGVIVDQLITTGTTDMGKHVEKNEKLIEYSNLGLFILSMFDPTGIAWMASEFVQPICGPSEFLGEIDDGTLYDALGLTTVDQAFLGSYGIWKKQGDGSVTINFESIDIYDVSVVIKSGGDQVAEVKVPSNGTAKWTSTVSKLQDKTLYLDRWRPGMFGLPGSSGGSLLLWVPRSSLGGKLVLNARLNVS